MVASARLPPTKPRSAGLSRVSDQVVGIGGSGCLGWSGSDKHLLRQRVPLCQPVFWAKQTRRRSEHAPPAGFVPDSIFALDTLELLQQFGQIHLDRVPDNVHIDARIPVHNAVAHAVQLRP